jgi:hypothetical protein
MEKSRDRSWSVVIPGCAFLAGSESILTVVVMDSGLALRAPRNDDRKKAGIAPGLLFFVDGRVILLEDALRAFARP